MTSSLFIFTEAEYKTSEFYLSFVTVLIPNKYVSLLYISVNYDAYIRLNSLSPIRRENLSVKQFFPRKSLSVYLCVKLNYSFSTLFTDINIRLHRSNRFQIT